MSNFCRLRQILSLNKLCGITRLNSKSKCIPRLVTRTYSSLGPEINPKFEQRARMRDRLSTDFKLVYYSRATLYYTVCYHASYLIFFSTIGTLIYTFMSEPIEYPVMNDYFNVPIQSQTETFTIYGLIVIINILLFQFCRAHVARIWYNPKTNKYLIVSCNGLPGSLMKKLECNPGDARRKYPTIENWFAQTLHSVNGKSRHFTDARFRYPIDYHKLVGNIK